MVKQIWAKYSLMLYHYLALDYYKLCKLHLENYINKKIIYKLVSIFIALSKNLNYTTLSYISPYLTINFLIPNLA